ncbi:hypothetical protein Vdis_0570 [Vulcanisaeta distributa DSM 14429]|uniref:Uncharacterized protein n=3 Tax=Vulcanisaeta TaxID=164450 RepID=E1QUW4_VULDI|nr:hypothetical protein Vdis_0570 [Vulcanisaeta distributa DSM 14429]BDR92341.1 hypothetical protein Vsou_14340 [Vulcanisaeta souniana JCM 11219]
MPFTCLYCSRAIRIRSVHAVFRWRLLVFVFSHSMCLYTVYDIASLWATLTALGMGERPSGRGIVGVSLVITTITFTLLVYGCRKAQGAH